MPAGRKPGVPDPRRTKRLEEMEALLLSGVPWMQTRRVIAERHEISAQQVTVDMRELERRWEADGTSREKLILLNAYRKALANEKYSAAVAAAARLQSSSGDHKKIAKHYERAGAQPDDNVERAVWAQRIAGLALEEVIANPSLSPDQRVTRIDKMCRTIALLMPFSEIHDADKRIRRDVESLEDEHKDPELEEVSDDESSEASTLRADPR